MLKLISFNKYEKVTMISFEFYIDVNWKILRMIGLDQN